MKPRVLRTWGLGFAALGIATFSHAIAITPGARVSKHAREANAPFLVHPLAGTALFVTEADIADDVVFQ